MIEILLQVVFLILFCICVLFFVRNRKPTYRIMTPSQKWKVEEVTDEDGDVFFIISGYDCLPDQIDGYFHYGSLLKASIIAQNEKHNGNTTLRVSAGREDWGIELVVKNIEKSQIAKTRASGTEMGISFFDHAL